MDLFSIICLTCRRRLKVTDPAALGTILACPGCGSMVEVRPPEGWQPNELVGGDATPVRPPPLKTKPAPHPAAAANVSSASEPVVNTSQVATASRGGWWLGLAAAGAAACAALLVILLTLPESPSKADPAPNDPASNDSAPVKPSQIAVTPPVVEKPAAAKPTEAVPPVVDSSVTAPPKETPASEAKPIADPPRPAEIVTPLPAAVAQSLPTFESDDDLDPPEQGSGVAFPRPTVETNWTARLADPLPAIRCRKLPLAGFADMISSLANGPVGIDVDALRELTLTADVQVSVELTNTNLGAALEAALSPVGLRAVIEGNHLQITRIGDRAALCSVPYSLSDLAADGTALRELAGSIQRLIAPDTWKESGGAALITPGEGTLVIHQTAAAHAQIVQFCEKLRLARGLPLRSQIDPHWLRLEPSWRTAQTSLAKPVTAIFFQPTSLAKMLDYLEARTQTRLLIDWRSLDRDGMGSDVEGLLRADQAPLESALATLVEPLKLATRIIDGKTVLITTRRGAARREIEFHRVRDILSANLSGLQLAERLTGDIAPQSWGSGKGAALFDPASQCLIISHSQAVQRQTEAFLIQLRAATAATRQN